MSTSAAPAPRPAPRLAPAPRDLLVAAAYAALVVALPVLGLDGNGLLGAEGGWALPVSLTVLLVACASLVWRRRRPELALAVAGPLSLAEILLGGQISAYFLLFEALFEPVMHGSRRLALLTTRAAIALGVLCLLAALVAGLPGQAVLLVAMLAALMISTPLLWGWEVRHHREARRAAEQLAGLEHELAATRAAHAVEAERRTIAHDLHDVIAGHLSAVSLHTGLAASLEDPAARDRSLTTARDCAHAALRDLRSMIGVLSSAEAGALPAVTLDWPSLTARLRWRDPQARVELAPAVTDPASIEPSVQAALLRIAAEAVTNAVRHGEAPLTMTVVLEDGPGAVTFTLTNRRATTDAPGTGVGRGTIAHRAEAVGGSAGSALAREDPQLWQVRARLPARARHELEDEEMPS